MDISVGDILVMKKNHPAAPTASSSSGWGWIQTALPGLRPGDDAHPPEGRKGYRKVEKKPEE